MNSSILGCVCIILVVIMYPWPNILESNYNFDIIFVIKIHETIVKFIFVNYFLNVCTFLATLSGK